MFVRLDRLALRPVRKVARSSQAIVSDEAERLVDGVLAGPLPEKLARSFGEHHVLERVATELLDTATAGGRQSDDLERVLERVLRSPALERWAASGEAARLVDPLVAPVLRSPAFKEAMLGILASPELRHALTDQTTGFGEDIAAAARARTARSDDAMEERVHSWFRLRRPSAAEPRPFAGFPTRGVALVLDVVLAQLAFLVGAASIALVASLVGASQTGLLTRLFDGAAWLIVSCVYFAGFWSAGGQTPGMRFMRVRVVDRSGASPSVPRSLLRFAGLLLAIIPLFAGFLTVLVDGRRRAVQDFIAGTVVLRDDELDLGVPDVSVAPANGSGTPSAPRPERLPTRDTRELPPASAQLRSTWVDVDGSRVHAVRGGDGPPVVLLHGFGISGNYMHPLARTLASSCTAFVPDLPGQGKSGPPPARWGIEEMADVLGGWLEAVGVREPLVVANSMGCQIVTALAVSRPDLVGPMVLIGPTVDPAHRAARRQLSRVLRDVVREPFSLVALTARDNAGRVDVRPLLTVARAALADRIEERLPLIGRRTVIVRGENDALVGGEWAEFAAGELPRGRLVVVPAEAHAVHFTRPKLVARIVGELLAEEREHGLGERLWHLEHGDVPAAQTDDAAARQEALPLLG
ncbi:MAG: alpha/beta fold hydrolase [Acidobacteria bacterium]|nr:alpha/beta fold hydrolase [Acidobacteriota bacterium]